MYTEHQTGGPEATDTASEDSDGCSLMPDSGAHGGGMVRDRSAHCLNLLFSSRSRHRPRKPVIRPFACVRSLWKRILCISGFRSDAGEGLDPDLDI